MITFRFYLVLVSRTILVLVFIDENNTKQLHSDFSQTQLAISGRAVEPSLSLSLITALSHQQ